MTRTMRILLALGLLVATVHPMLPAATAGAPAAMYFAASGAEAPLLAVTDAPWRVPAVRESCPVPLVAPAPAVADFALATGAPPPELAVASPRRRQRARRRIRDDGPPH